AQRLRGFGTDPECRDACAPVASARARYRPDAGFGMRDQKSDCADLLCPSQLDAAVHMLRRKRILVADQDDPARNTMRLPLEICLSAQTEIQDFRHETRSRCRA